MWLLGISPEEVTILNLDRVSFQIWGSILLSVLPAITIESDRLLLLVDFRDACGRGS